MKRFGKDVGWSSAAAAADPGALEKTERGFLVKRMLLKVFSCQK